MAGSSTPYESDGLSATDFKNFMLKNNLVITAAAITIGIASASFIKSFVGSILMPSVYFVIGKIILQNFHKKLYKTVGDIFGDKADFDFDTFVKDLLTWIFIVIAAYFIMDFVVRRWLLGPSSTDLKTPAPAAALAYPINLNSQHNNSPASYDPSVYTTTITADYLS